MINFVIFEGNYKKVLSKFINPILPYVTNYIISKEAKEKCVNVIFFTEDYIFQHLKAQNGKGINVFMTHGIADKNWRDCNSTNKFDYIFVTGDLWVNKLIKQGMSKDKIKIGGYTRLDDLCNKKISYVKNTPNKKSILFAPTHTCSITTYNKLNSLIKELEKNYNVLYSPHPAQNKGKITELQFLEADVVVGDFGSSMYEAWALGKPCVLPNWLIKKDVHNYYLNSFEDYIYQKEIDYHAKSERDFIEKINIASRHGITQGAVDFIDGIFNKELRGVSGEKTAKELLVIEKLIR